jgi:hypothetical protein
MQVELNLMFFFFDKTELEQRNQCCDGCVAGCFCVYNSTESLEYVRDSLEKTLFFSEAEDSETDSHLHGLPIVIVLAHDPAIASEHALEDLRIRGHELANRSLMSLSTL